MIKKSHKAKLKLKHNKNKVIRLTKKKSKKVNRKLLDDPICLSLECALFTSVNTHTINITNTEGNINDTIKRNEITYSIINLPEQLKLQGNTLLKSLSITNVNLDKNISFIITILQQYNLILLSLTTCNIGDNETRDLAVALKGNTTLKKLSLISNEISDAGAIALVNELKIMTGLQYLDLSENNIGDNGAKALVDALINNKKLEQLYIENNNINLLTKQNLITHFNNENVNKQKFLDLEIITPK